MSAVSRLCLPPRSKPILVHRILPSPNVDAPPMVLCPPRTMSSQLLNPFPVLELQHLVSQTIGVVVFDTNDMTNPTET